MNRASHYFLILQEKLSTLSREFYRKHDQSYEADNFNSISNILSDVYFVNAEALTHTLSKGIELFLVRPTVKLESAFAHSLNSQL